MGGIDWGDVPTWLASVCAAGAFAAALLLFRVEAKRDRPWAVGSGVQHV